MKRWTKEEIDVLGDLIGNYPINVLVDKYNHKIALLNKKRQKQNLPLFPSRTENALELKIKREFNRSVICFDDNFSIAELSRILGFSYCRVQNWMRKKQLKTYKRNNLANSHHMISIKDFHTFAKKYPHLIMDADQDGLYFLLGEEAENIIQLKDAKKPKKKLKIKDVFASTIIPDHIYTNIIRAC